MPWPVCGLSKFDMNVQTVPNYVFPRESREEIGVTIANRVKDMLLTGSPLRGQDGLSTRPKFINRRGAGGDRDKTLTISPEVRFIDDGPGSIPHVLIVGIQADTGFDEWGDDQWILEVTLSLDCRASGMMPEGTTVGFNEGRADAVLGDFVWSFLDNKDVMVEWGFCNSETRKEPPGGGAVDKNGAPLNFQYPLTSRFEVYVWRVNP